MTRLINGSMVILALSALITPAVHAAQTRYEYQLHLTHHAAPATMTRQPAQSFTQPTEASPRKATVSGNKSIQPVTSGNPYIRPASSSW